MNEKECVYRKAELALRHDRSKTARNSIWFLLWCGNNDEWRRIERRRNELDGSEFGWAFTNKALRKESTQQNSLVVHCDEKSRVWRAHVKGRTRKGGKSLCTEIELCPEKQIGKKEGLCVWENGSFLINEWQKKQSALFWEARREKT